ncbi:MAG: hypothetical protein QXZ68_04140 [Candidatus Bathyarchaeia archaeon]
MKDGTGELICVIGFALGGTFLLFAIFQFLKSLSEPWISKELAMFFCLLLGFFAFLLIGLSILSMLEMAQLKRSKINNKKSEGAIGDLL